MDRRTSLKNLGLTIPFMAVPAVGTMAAAANKDKKPLHITKVKAIPTCPHGLELIVVKVETNDPKIYGYGCATFRQRAHAVVAAIDEYLDDFCRGKDPDRIEDIWQTAYVTSYWRNGPVLNNALSGLDQALWDIKGKRAGMPVYQLLGGKCRFAVDTYAHASGSSYKEVIDQVKSYMERGYRHVRIQMGGYGSAGLADQPDFKKNDFGQPDDHVMDSYTYMEKTKELFARVREACGWKIELLHDIHERLEPIHSIRLIEELEKYRPFFIEDPFSPENMGYFEMLREHSTAPIAMGELFNNINEFLEPMSRRWFDFIRIHISQIGGITPAMKVARLGEWFGIRTAWHGPGDVSPVGHAANAHIDLAVWNFGIQESVHFSDTLRKIFPGAPNMKEGFMYVNEVPGLGVEVNEDEALKYPLPPKNDYNWTQLRKNDGTPVRP